MKRSELVQLLQWWLTEACDQLESDEFLPGLDVQAPTSVELMNDIIESASLTDKIERDTEDTVKLPYRN